MLRATFAAVVFACLAAALSLQVDAKLNAGDAALVTQEIKRVLEIATTGSPVVLERTFIRLKNTGSANLTEYVLKLPIDRAQRLGYITAVNEMANLSKLDCLAGKIGKTYHEYIIKLLSPVQAGEKMGLDIELAFRDGLTTVPEFVEQNGEQFMLMKDKIGLGTPYTTTKFEFEFNMPTVKRPLEYSPENAKIIGRVMSYGPYDHDPGMEVEFSVRFFSPKSSLVVKSLKSEVWIRNHERSIEYDNWIEVEHVGAKLKKPFSRLDYMRHGENRISHAMTNMVIYLPESPHNFYYGDEIGNVSTSWLQKAAGSMTPAVFQFRYPLYGGWKYNWNYGYETTSEDALVGNFRPLEPHSIRVQIAPILPEILVEDLELRVVLPEGSRITNVMVDHPGGMKSILEVPAVRGDNGEATVPGEGEYVVEKKYYYFDTIGRPVVMIRRGMWLKPETAYIHVTYQPTIHTYLAKPVLVALLVGSILLGIYFWSIGCNAQDIKRCGVAAPHRKKND